MSSNRVLAVLIAIGVALILVYSSIFIVNEREQALVLRFGKIERVVTEPGLYFKAPFGFMEFDTVQYIEDRLLRFDLEELRAQVRDGRRYLVDAFIAFRIKDPRAFRENVSGSLAIAQDNMRTRLDAALRRVYGQRSFEAALSEQRAEMMREVRDELRLTAAVIGIEIVDVRVRRTELLPEVREQTFERMRAERLAEAAGLRAQGTQDALRIRAEADREAVVTVAEARRESEILRGEGDGERNRIFAAAFNRDPEFFEFYRSMLAYEKALERSDTTMVLSPNSDFFRFFRDPTGGGDGTGGESENTPAAPAQ